MGWIERPPGFFRRMVPGGIFRLDPEARSADGRPMVYLTFDDGPVPEATPMVLDLLDRYGIKATFFMVADNAARYPELLAEVRRRGHRVGNHTFHHLQGVKTKRRHYFRDILEAGHILKTDLFRPPHGWLTLRQSRQLRRRYRIIMYDLVSRDYSRRLDADRVILNVKRYARPGAVIVFHDSIKALPRLEKALPEAIEWLIAEGYAFGVI